MVVWLSNTGVVVARVVGFMVSFEVVVWGWFSAKMAENQVDSLGVGLSLVVMLGLAIAGCVTAHVSHS